MSILPLWELDEIMEEGQSADEAIGLEENNRG